MQFSCLCPAPPFSCLSKLFCFGFWLLLLIFVQDDRCFVLLLFSGSISFTYRCVCVTWCVRWWKARQLCLLSLRPSAQQMLKSSPSLSRLAVTWNRYIDKGVAWHPNIFIPCTHHHTHVLMMMGSFVCLFSIRTGGLLQENKTRTPSRWTEECTHTSTHTQCKTTTTIVTIDNLRSLTVLFVFLPLFKLTTFE